MSVPIYIELVNENDEPIGAEEKLLVHQKGLLHRAFSILVFNSKNEVLLHQRALHKYHSGGLWTNTCCGHPNAGEAMEDAVHRRLLEEMGFDCPLEMKFKFHYSTTFENGLIENEIDHFYAGFFDEKFVPNPEEVADFRWVAVNELQAEVTKHPGNYTFWFREILRQEAFQELAFLS